MDFGAELRDHNINQMSFEDTEDRDFERKASYAMSHKINESEAVSQSKVRGDEENIPYGV